MFIQDNRHQRSQRPHPQTTYWGNEFREHSRGAIIKDQDVSPIGSEGKGTSIFSR